MYPTQVKDATVDHRDAQPGLHADAASISPEKPLSEKASERVVVCVLERVFLTESLQGRRVEEKLVNV